MLKPPYNHSPKWRNNFPFCPSYPTLELPLVIYTSVKPAPFTLDPILNKFPVKD